MCGNHDNSGKNQRWAMDLDLGMSAAIEFVPANEGSVCSAT
jgi:hypothetical protein